METRPRGRVLHFWGSIQRSKKKRPDAEATGEKENRNQPIPSYRYGTCFLALRAFASRALTFPLFKMDPPKSSECGTLLPTAVLCNMFQNEMAAKLAPYFNRPNFVVWISPSYCCGA